MFLEGSVGSFVGACIDVAEPSSAAEIIYQVVQDVKLDGCHLGRVEAAKCFHAACFKVSYTPAELVYLGVLPGHRGAVSHGLDSNVRVSRTEHGERGGVDLAAAAVEESGNKREHHVEGALVLCFEHATAVSYTHLTLPTILLV